MQAVVIENSYKPASPSTNSHLDYRLRMWGRWSRKIIEHGLGYPSRSIEGRLQQDGGVLSKSTAPMPLPYNPLAEEMDGLIIRLGGYWPWCAQAVRIKYASGNPVKDELKKCNMSETAFRTHIRSSKMWLSGKFDN